MSMVVGTYDHFFVRLIEQIRAKCTYTWIASTETVHTLAGIMNGLLALYQLLDLIGILKNFTSHHFEPGSAAG